MVRPVAPSMLPLLTALAAALANVLATGVSSSPAMATTTTTPMRGWMTWERFTCETDCARFPETCISERLIRTMADAMNASGFVAAGYDYIQIDDCWAASQRGASGAIIPDPTRFPSGMKAQADHVVTQHRRENLLIC